MTDNYEIKAGDVLVILRSVNDHEGLSVVSFMAGGDGPDLPADVEESLLVLGVGAARLIMEETDMVAEAGVAARLEDDAYEGPEDDEEEQPSNVINFTARTQCKGNA